MAGQRCAPAKLAGGRFSPSPGRFAELVNDSDWWSELRPDVARPLAAPSPASSAAARSDRPRPTTQPKPYRSHMLIDEDWISIRVHSDEARRSRCALVRLLLQLHPLCLQLALQVADVGE